MRVLGRVNSYSGRNDSYFDRAHVAIDDQHRHQLRLRLRDRFRRQRWTHQTSALEVVRLDGTATVAAVVSIVDLHKVSVNDRLRGCSRTNPLFRRLTRPIPSSSNLAILRVLLRFSFLVWPRACLRSGGVVFEQPLNHTRSWSNKVVIASTFLLMVGVCSEGCSSTPFGSTETKTFEWPSNEKLDWLNPSRCIDPCEKQPSDMIEVGAMGKAQPGSGHRVRRFVQPALEALFKAAGRAGHKIQIISAFRDYNEQIEFWHRFENEPGRVALPGHSEHQLGTTVDLDTSAAGEIWFANNAHTFGFTLSYPDTKQRITGFREEPWHLRFVGQNLAQLLFEKHWCLEEYFRQNSSTAAPSGDCTKCSSPLSRRACGDISISGLCRGDVMTWCFDGTLAAVDCTTSNRTCSTKNGQPSCEFSK